MGDAQIRGQVSPKRIRSSPEGAVSQKTAGGGAEPLTAPRREHHSTLCLLLTQPCPPPHRVSPKGKPPGAISPERTPRNVSGSYGGQQWPASLQVESNSTSTPATIRWLQPHGAQPASHRRWHQRATSLAGALQVRPHHPCPTLWKELFSAREERA